MNTYPRELRTKEADLINAVLPADRPGYRTYRDLVASMVVLGAGRRGAGNLVLGFAGDTADTTAPLAPVIAYGMLETTLDAFSITVREYVGDQIDIEIVSSKSEEIPDHFEEKRRWTYSTWLPGYPSPASNVHPREVRIDDDHVLAIAARERRVWIYEGTSGMNILIPVTNYYNEIMLRKGIRDPAVALNSALLFSDGSSYSDEDLRAAFVAYNALKPKVHVVAPEPAPRTRGIFAFFKNILSSGR
ncbi:MAG: hypothetical protein OEM41_05130 [Ignavibacteria bacterium]|nr:hypothetical protein [Ignavibacteria bacterium]